MIKGILYTSNTGLTKKYAGLLGEELKIPVYELVEGKKHLKKGDEIIYLTWIAAGSLKKYNKANRRYKIKATCAVGMMRPGSEQNQPIQEKHNIKEGYFYLLGGFNKDGIKGIYKIVINIMEKFLKPKLEEKENKTQDENDLLDMLSGKSDHVSKENLNDVIAYIKGIR